MSYQPKHARTEDAEHDVEGMEEGTSEVTRIRFDEDTASWIAASPAAGETRTSTPEEEAAAREQVDAELGSGSRPTTVMGATGTRVMLRDDVGSGATATGTRVMPHREASGEAWSGERQASPAGEVDPTVLRPYATVPQDGGTAASRSSARKSKRSDQSAGSTESIGESAKAKHKGGHRVLSFLGRAVRFLLKLVLKVVMFVVILAIIAVIGLTFLSAAAPDVGASLEEQAIELLGGLVQDAAEDAGETVEDLAESAGTGTSESSGTSSSTGTGGAASESSGGASSSNSSSKTSSGGSSGASSGTSDQGTSSSSGAEDSSPGADSSSSSSSTPDASSDGAASTDAPASDGSTGDALADEAAE